MYDGSLPSPGRSRRQNVRVSVKTEVTLRRDGNPRFRVSVRDLSQQGCQIEFVERPMVGDQVWVRFDSLEALEATVRWVEDFVGGLEFERPLHPAVFAALSLGLSA